MPAFQGIPCLAVIKLFRIPLNDGEIQPIVFGVATRTFLWRLLREESVRTFPGGDA